MIYLFVKKSNKNKDLYVEIYNKTKIRFDLHLKNEAKVILFTYEKLKQNYIKQSVCSHVENETKKCKKQNKTKILFTYKINSQLI